MRDKSTTRFLELLEAQNARVAANEVEARRKPTSKPDLIRQQREAERREKWGQLRAREHNTKRPKRMRRIFPFVDPS